MTEFQQKYHLSRAEWQQRRKLHEQEIDGLLSDYLIKRERQGKNPVMDFLFDYYSFRPALLRRWSPGMHVVLEDAQVEEFPDEWEYRSANGGRLIPAENFPGHRLPGLEWVLNLLEQTSGRSPVFGCFGMHEWAMVYKSNSRQHNDIPLRFSEENIAEFVESRPPVCTHYDAYRFFTREASPLNKYHLSRETMPEFEQPGCLHTNMDLYKWSVMFYPWVGSEHIRECFLLALETRTLDMQASPYDLRDYGYEPVKVETKNGRQEYKNRQTDIYEKAKPLRKRLIRNLKNFVQLST